MKSFIQSVKIEKKNSTEKVKVYHWMTFLSIIALNDKKKTRVFQNVIYIISVCGFKQSSCDQLIHDLLGNLPHQKSFGNP